MKNLLIAATVCLCFTTSCNQVAGWLGNESDSTATVENNAIVWERDESINESNAYSDLFLDSAAIENYISKENVSDSSAQKIRNFYKVRNYQYAWFTTQGLTEQGRGIWSLQSAESVKTEAALKQRMDSLMMNDSIFVQAGDSSYAQTELGLTEEFIAYAGMHKGIINESNLYYLVPAKRQDAMQLADSILNKNKDSALYAGNAVYTGLKNHLTHYYNAAKNGGWQPLPAQGKNLKKGSSGQEVSAIKKRLAATNDYTNADTTSVFSDSLAMAVQQYQKRNGLAPTGMINDSLINILNVPAQERLEQILVNMNRAMWMQPADDSNRIVVNIPSFMLYAYEGSSKVLEMPVIVGKEGSGTVMFNGEINEVVFNPTWNIPQSIVEKEIMPAMKKDKNYLKSRNMEIVSQNDSIPTIRQMPGRDNAMGQVKFLFPNSYDIYLHDTPDKSLFSQQERALSHGCIRVQDPLALAQFVLKNQQEWTPEKISSSMNGSQEQTVKVNQQKPVYITYYTAWVDENGHMNFRNDVYGHDNGTRSRMFVRS